MDRDKLWTQLSMDNRAREVQGCWWKICQFGDFPTLVWHLHKIWGLCVRCSRSATKLCRGKGLTLVHGMFTGLPLTPRVLNIKNNEFAHANDQWLRKIWIFVRIVPLHNHAWSARMGKSSVSLDVQSRRRGSSYDNRSCLCLAEAGWNLR